MIGQRGLKSIAFEKAGPYLAVLLLLAIVGFWHSYFSRLFISASDFNTYFHFHALMASLWLIILIIQPILIKKRQWQLHRQVGWFSHFVLVLFYVSAILLTHHQQSIDFHYIGGLIPFRDLSMISIAYFIAMKYRRTVAIHARGMIATGIAFIEPALVRALGNLFPSMDYPYYWTIALIYLTWTILMIVGNRHKQGRWVFPLLLGLNILFHAIIVFRLPITFFEKFAQWFVSLPLT